MYLILHVTSALTVLSEPLICCIIVPYSDLLVLGCLLYYTYPC